MKASGSPDLILKFKEMRKITKKHIHLSYIQCLKNLYIYEAEHGSYTFPVIPFREVETKEDS